MKKNHLARTGAGVLALSLVLGLSGCGSTADSSDAQSSVASSGAASSGVSTEEQAQELKVVQELDWMDNEGF